MAAELEVWTGERPSELSTPEPLSELPPAGWTFVQELTSGEMFSELPVPDHISSILHPASSINNNIASTPGSAPIRPEIPISNSRAPSLDLVEPGSSAYNPPMDRVRISSLKLKGPSERYANRTAEPVNAESNATGASWAFSNRRSELPRLSILTTQSSRLNSVQSTSAIASQRNTQANLNMRPDSSSFSNSGELSQTIESSVRSAYKIEPLSTHPTAFTRPLHAEVGFPNVDEVVSPSSAKSALQSSPFDPSALRSPVMDNQQWALQRPLPNRLLVTGLIPATPDSSSGYVHLPYRGWEQGTSATRDPQNFHSTSSQVRFDCTPFQGIQTSKHLLQNLICRVISLRHLCKSTLDSGTNGFNNVFGYSGYATFMQGLQVMGSLFQGSVPRTGIAICALVQVALQMVPSQVSSDFADNVQSSIRRDIYCMSHAIEDKNARESFLNDMNVLLVKWQSIHASHEQERPLDVADAQLATDHFPVDQCSIDEWLRDSTIKQICSCFLDKLECLKLAEKNSATPFYPPVHDEVTAGNYKSIMNNVIHPLLHYDACASMNRVVCVVKEQLQRGSLYNVREVEIMLMYYAPQCDVPKETLHENVPRKKRKAHKRQWPLSRVSQASQDAEGQYRAASRMWKECGSSYSTNSHGTTSSNKASSYAPLSAEQLQAWQRTQYRHEQIPTGQQKNHFIPEIYRKETAATREDVKKFNQDADATSK
ncbi:MAG: hypothetical protein Q9202_002807 [Teloschistes flavicans]